MLMPRQYVLKLRDRVITFGGADPGVDFKIGYPSLAPGASIDDPEVLDCLARVIIEIQNGEYTDAPSCNDSRRPKIPPST